MSQNISKYASDIDQAVTFSSKEGKQYQSEWETSLSNKEKQLSYAVYGYHSQKYCAVYHEVYLSYKKGYCSNAKALSLIQLNMADLPQSC